MSNLIETSLHVQIRRNQDGKEMVELTGRCTDLKEPLRGLGAPPRVTVIDCALEQHVRSQPNRARGFERIHNLNPEP
jgi:hypothetical protein